MLAWVDERFDARGPKHSGKLRFLRRFSNVVLQRLRRGEGTGHGH